VLVVVAAAVGWLALRICLLNGTKTAL
jgi:hypothetical protein